MNSHHHHQIYTGGKLSVGKIHDFLEASYQDAPPADIGRFHLDTDLSTPTATVYYNPDNNKAVVAHRGTKGLYDWKNNLAYSVGQYDTTDRYRQGKKVQQEAEAKYGAKNISTLGHSQGSILARKLGKNTKEIINVNPAYLGEKNLDNEYNIRSGTDVVSGVLSPVQKAREYLYPSYSKSHDITIPTKSINPLKEHSYDILNRLDRRKKIGKGKRRKGGSVPVEDLWKYIHAD